MCLLSLLVFLLDVICNLIFFSCKFVCFCSQFLLREQYPKNAWISHNGHWVAASDWANLFLFLLTKILMSRSEIFLFCFVLWRVARFRLQFAAPAYILSRCCRFAWQFFSFRLQKEMNAVDDAAGIARHCCCCRCRYGFVVIIVADVIVCCCSCFYCCWDFSYANLSFI